MLNEIIYLYSSVNFSLYLSDFWMRGHQMFSYQFVFKLQLLVFNRGQWLAGSGIIETTLLTDNNMLNETGAQELLNPFSKIFPASLFQIFS